ncbi:MAG: hypothetical protein A2Z96_05945 [Spirochaetes bacterium GWB1_48_6]|nr:MAG: hypothetical protein A2Z96_05945 [Spirochaetes bacterium GWB1_48_6]
MVTPFFSTWTSSFKEYFTSTWKLLSQTTDILSRTPLFSHYERALREWRLVLQSRSGDLDEVSRIHRQILDLRKELRSCGFDLSLGSRDLVLQGYRNDSCLGEGFQRMVLFITDKDVVYLIGTSNHVELARFLESRIGGRSGVVTQRHYLWYRWFRDRLVLSASDTETAQDWEVFKKYVERNKNYLLSKLKKL